jgi:predicted secreted hydrolase
MTPASTGTWTSPDSHVAYPTRWTVTIPGVQTTLDVTATATNQELLVPVPRLEGSAQVTGTAGGQPVPGATYVEATGAQ